MIHVPCENVKIVIEFIWRIALPVSFLRVFYNKQFCITTHFSKITDKEVVAKFKKQTPQLCLWTLILVHILNPWCLWKNTKRNLLSHSILCSIIQIPPFRAFFQTKLGDWSSILIPYMPATSIASSLRQSIGPPYMLYTIAFSFQQYKEESVPSWSWYFSLISLVSVVLAGVFIRPDNDWAHNSWFVGTIHSKSRRCTHGFLMMISTILNLLVFCFSVILGMLTIKFDSHF